MYCNKCGSELIDNAKFCTNCGAKVNSEAEKIVKKKCCLCGSELNRNDTSVLFVGGQDDYEICNNCDSHISAIETAQTRNEIEYGITYLKYRLKDISDVKVKAFINNMIHEYSDVLNNSQTINMIKNNIGDTNSGIWIKGLKAVVWLVFITIIIAGIAFGVAQGGGLGFVLFLAFLIGAFLSVAGMMVLLGAAEDIRAIRIKLLQKETK